MKLREQKRLLVYLEMLVEKMSQEVNIGIHPKITKYLAFEDLIDIVLWTHPNTYRKELLSLKSKEELINLIEIDVNILLYTIAKIEKSMTNYVKYSPSEVSTFFKKTQNEIHYLASKPADDWDEYDKANYHSLLSKTGTAKIVYGVFTDKVLSENVYAVTTKPSYFFDSKEEAEAEIDNIIKEEKFKRDDLTVHKLWLIQNQEI